MNLTELHDNIQTLYEEIKLINSGEVAKYIPQLATVNPELFGISICTIDGAIINVGDTKSEFCLQSCSKVLTYLLACHLNTTEEIHKHVGHEPSGKAFNDFCFNDDGLPHNPMINSGAIMMISMIGNQYRDMSARYQLIRDFIRKMTGYAGYLGYDNGVYLSERDHAYRNRALANMMMDGNVFPDNTNIEKTLDLYFQTCSITCNTETGAMIAATLANRGVCPINNEKVIEPNLVQNCLTLMSTCGMYDYSGGFAFEVGIPAKSGVSGCILLSIPDVAGICIWSPPLDKRGNSVRGVEFARRLVQIYPDFHIYNNKLTKISAETSSELSYDKQIMIQKLIHAASNNNIDAVKSILKDYDVNINDMDYDKRTALHLAAVEGHYDMVVHLVENGAIIDIKDRYGNTPYSEAFTISKPTENHKKICDYLMTNIKPYSDTTSPVPVMKVEKIIGDTKTITENITIENKIIDDATQSAEQFFKSLSST